MDLEEWEFVSDDGWVGYDEDSGRKIFPKEKFSINTNSIVDMNYFHTLIESPQKDSVPAAAERTLSLDPTQSSSASSIDDQAAEVVKEVIEEKVSVLPKVDSDEQIMGMDVPKVEEALELETISNQVFFTKVKEAEQFVDMKLDSPKSLNKGMLSPIDVGMHQFEETVDDQQDTDMEETEMETEKEHETFAGYEKKQLEADVGSAHEPDKSNVWKLGMTGIGALFSFGVACATTVCIVALGAHQREKHQSRVHFHVFGDDKSINQVVHHANKLNEAISAVRSGAPVTRAQITTGGYFEGL